MYYQSTIAGDFVFTDEEAKEMAEKLKDAMDGMGTSILRTRSSSVPLPSCNTVAFGALYRVCKIHYYSLYALHSLNVASLEFMFSCVLSLR